MTLRAARRTFSLPQLILSAAVAATLLPWPASPAATVPEQKKATPVAAPGVETPPPPPPPAIRPLPGPHFLTPLKPLDLRLPTDNRGFFEGRPETFFMGVDRTTEGKTSLVWEGGQYGFVRNPIKHGEETVYVRFHEGMDIAPTVRDNRGEPLDLVCAISSGRVVFTNTKRGASNYGNYVVVEHDWGCGPLYSLYGHLMRVDVQPGQLVRRGEPLGRLGYTGDGIDRRRAHVHLELNLLISERYDMWHQQNDPLHQPANNVFHGWNLVGLDIAALYRAHAADPALTIPAFIATQDPYFKVTAPNKGMPELLRRYPWLWPAPRAESTEVNAPSWEVSFTASGLPVKMEPSGVTVPYPAITGVVPFDGKHTWRTLNRVTGTGNAAQLTAKGTEYVNLILGAF